ncbi:TPA: hypothetical protein QCR36_003944 [Bacillus cereus]|nr:hypothetical protein [Bacillus cereus]HDR4742413.1 hypothetical protein [Bacillus cereus]HDR4748000.1 hypothetical protein [Bacillus cereus]HDR4753474.1 hypothetical protein [Bacillus cereus]HDR4770683.1 hypothetical protein [Bacillus cereus]
MVKITIETSDEVKTSNILTSLEKMVGAMNRYVQENEGKSSQTRKMSVTDPKTKVKLTVEETEKAGA